MRVSNEFDVPLPPADAWETLRDIEAIVPCLPGAEVTEKVDELVYRGHIAVKLGPVALRFRGSAQFTEIDDDNRLATVQAQAKDEKGRGGVNSSMRFHLEPMSSGSRVFVETDLQLSGNIAQYGRATGVVEQLADQIVAEFADNLRTRLDETGRDARDRALEEPGPTRGKPVSVIGLFFKVWGASLNRWARSLFRRT